MTCECLRPPPNRLREADLFLGIYKTLTGTPEEARPLLRSSIARCPHDFTEYSDAKLELLRLDHLNAPPTK